MENPLPPDPPTPPASSRTTIAVTPTSLPPKRWDWRPKVRWFAAEILIVVAGVLLALAINAWWQARQQAREEQRLLVALLDEFTANQDRLTEIVAFHEDLKATTSALLAISVDPARSISADSADQLLADVTWWSSYTTLESTVLDAAVQDAQLDLIQTDSLRRLLGEWRSEVASAAAQSNQEFEHYAGAWLPLLRAEAEVAQISNKATTIPGSDEPYQGEPMPLPQERTDHRPLIQTRAARNVLAQKLWIEDDVLYQMNTLKPLLRRILDALDREIR